MKVVCRNVSRIPRAQWEHATKHSRPALTPICEKTLSPNVSQEIRYEVAAELELILSNQQELITYKQLPHHVTLTDNEGKRRFLSALEKYILFYQDMDPTKRSRSPRLKTSNKGS